MAVIALSEHRLIRIVVLCALYVAQGVPYGFLTVTLAAALVEGGLDAGEIGGIFALGTLPWAFKWVWGPFVDRFGNSRFGRRRPWILAAQAGMVVSLIGMWMIPEPTVALRLLGVMIVIHNVFNSLQDVCVDALAVDLLPPEDRGKASGLMYGAKYLGTAIGGGGLSILAYRYGLHAAFAGMIAIVAAIALLPLLTVERPGEARWPGDRAAKDGNAGSNDSPSEAPSPASIGSLLRQLARAFGNRPAIMTGVVAVLATAASGLLAPIGAILFVRDLGWTQEEYGAATGGIAVFAGLIGSVGGGFLADLVGPRRVVASCSLILGGLLLFFGLEVIPDRLASDTPMAISIGSETTPELDGSGMPSPTPQAIPPASTGESASGSDVGGRDTTFVAYLVVEALLVGAINAAFFAVCFGVCRPEVAATQFTAYMALMNLGMSGSQAVAGVVNTHQGVPGAWTIGAIAQFSVAFLIPLTLLAARITPVGRSPGN
ncbi:MAG: hypothetical protein CMJ51_06970 [Planctomycetaceae bacterium]|nr:hypothetical protein [Planctomycetaceae bacterium]